MSKIFYYVRYFLYTNILFLILPFLVVDRLLVVISGTKRRCCMAFWAPHSRMFSFVARGNIAAEGNAGKRFGCLRSTVF